MVLNLALVLFMSGCMLVPKRDTSSSMLIANDSERVKVHFSSRVILGNIASSNEDSNSGTRKTTQFFTEVLNANKFEISDSPDVRYAVHIQYTKKTSDYAAQKDSPYRRLGFKAWEGISIVSACVIPYHSEIEQNFLVTVTDLKNQHIHTYQANGDLDLWYFILFFPLVEMSLPSTGIQKYNIRVLSDLLAKARQEMHP